MITAAQHHALEWEMNTYVEWFATCDRGEYVIQDNETHYSLWTPDEPGRFDEPRNKYKTITEAKEAAQRHCENG